MNKPEMYSCHAAKTWLGENETPMEDVMYFKVRATSHIQHRPGATNLQGLSKSGLEKIRQLRADGYFVTVMVGGYDCVIEND